MRISVPDLTHPTLCWAQSPAMVRCTLPKSHPGPHSWQRSPAPRLALNAVYSKTVNQIIMVPQPTQIER